MDIQGDMADGRSEGGATSVRASEHEGGSQGNFSVCYRSTDNVGCKRWGQTYKACWQLAVSIRCGITSRGGIIVCGGNMPTPPGRAWIKSWRLEQNSTDAGHRKSSRSPYWSRRRWSATKYVSKWRLAWWCVVRKFGERDTFQA